MNCIIIPGCPPNNKESIAKAKDPKRRTYDTHWMPWTKKELTKKGIKTEVALMPNPWQPKYREFKGEFEKYKINKNTILIGHSCGTAFLVKWLGETKQKVNRLILISPWKIPDENDKIKIEFYGFKIDKTIKERVKKIIYFTADNEAKDGKESLKIYKKALDGKIINIKGYGHYIEKHMKTTKFPELLEEILN